MELGWEALVALIAVVFAIQFAFCIFILCVRRPYSSHAGYEIINA